MNQFSKNKNNLTNTLSPYLKQHSNNPVNWFPWVDEAFNIAQKDDIPILLSIGYSSCHWCHVMAHESFENHEIADLMNNLYVNIKVDREERPDIDNIYMSALHSIGEQGGWPLTMFLTPTGEPFWGGTYFPPVPKYGRPSFPSILKEISRIYCDEKDKVLSNANAIKEHISLLEFKKEQNTENKFNINHFIKAFESITKQLDYEYGGLHSSQKFPNVEIIKLIQNNAISTNNKKLLSFIDLTLKNMCQGGIYDHLEGGFSRYTVDQKWLIPHFEKM
ncbi:MAG: thioredoxin domain-containing protein, partial [Rhodobiaceae bacterium]|nr:thioredoxin domain-containing protein [Rhodobiaceae bacterium]